MSELFKYAPWWAKWAALGGSGIVSWSLQTKFAGHETELLVLGAGLIFIALVGAVLGWKKRHFSSAPPIIPDWPIRDLFFHIDPDAVDETETRKDAWLKVGRDILTRLSTKQLEAWGEPSGISSPRLVPIPQRFWESADFTYMFFGEGERYKELVHAQSQDSDGRIEYRNLTFSRTEALAIWPGKKALDADDHSIWWAFAVPIVFLLVLLSPMIVTDVPNALDYVASRLRGPPKPTPIPQNALLIGQLNLQQGPQIEDGKLLVRVQLKNTSNETIYFVAKRTLFVFNETLFLANPDTVSGTLVGQESIHYRIGLVPPEALNQKIHELELGYSIWFGPPNSPAQWQIERTMKCRTPANNFNLGNCKYSINTNEAVK